MTCARVRAWGVCLRMRPRASALQLRCAALRACVRACVVRVLVSDAIRECVHGTVRVSMCVLGASPQYVRAQLSIPQNSEIRCAQLSRLLFRVCVCVCVCLSVSLCVCVLGGCDMRLFGRRLLRAVRLPERPRRTPAGERARRLVSFRDVYSRDVYRRRRVGRVVGMRPSCAPTAPLRFGSHHRDQIGLA